MRKVAGLLYMLIREAFNKKVKLTKNEKINWLGKSKFYITILKIIL